MLAASSSRLTPETASRAAMSLSWIDASASRLTCAVRVGQAHVAGELLDGRDARDSCRHRARRARSASASASALRLSPVAPALLRTVKRVARRGRAVDLHAPAVDVDVGAGGVGEAAGAVDRVGSRRSELDVRPWSAAARWSDRALRPRVIVPVPVFVAAAAARIGAAAATRDGSVIATLMPASASRVGLDRCTGRRWRCPRPPRWTGRRQRIGSPTVPVPVKLHGRARVLAPQRVAAAGARST